MAVIRRWAALAFAAGCFALPALLALLLAHDWALVVLGQRPFPRNDWLGRGLGAVIGLTFAVPLTFSLLRVMIADDARAALRLARAFGSLGWLAVLALLIGLWARFNVNGATLGRFGRQATAIGPLAALALFAIAALLASRQFGLMCGRSLRRSLV